MTAEGDLDLQRVLPELKRRGCNLLVTGEVNPTVSMRASRRMFGEGDRRRVVGLTRQAAMNPDAWLPRTVGTDDGNVELVELSQAGRSAATADGDDGIDPVARSMETAIASAASDDLDPSDLRVGVYSLMPLDGRFDGAAVERFVARLTDAVVAHDGMGHFHLPRENDAAIVERLDPLFDVRVEIRQLAARNPTPEQRWHVDGASTGWVQL